VLFDLKGRRRRVVQVVYLMLAVLMGGGLVFFGIGGDVSGGLFDAFSERGGSGNDIVEERIEKNEEKVEANPEDAAALKALVRDHFSLARNEVDPDDGRYTDEGKDELAEADEAWKLYLVAADKPDAALATLMIQIYDPVALNKPADAAQAAEIITEARPKDAASFLALFQAASQAGQKRKADLAAKKALSLAEDKQERALIQANIDALQAQQGAAIPQG